MMMVLNADGASGGIICRPNVKKNHRGINEK
jgi:hypothetical protein